MAKQTKTVTLYTPDGRSHTTSDPTEIVNLKARGYAEKPKAKPKVASATGGKVQSSD